MLNTFIQIQGILIVDSVTDLFKNYTLGRVSTTDEVNAYASTDEGMEKGIIQLTETILTMDGVSNAITKKK